MKEIAVTLFKLGATAYGGPAMMGVMEAELQARRGWVSRERFVEGVSIVSMLPGATATQLGIFLGYARGGWWGGLVAGLSFVLPGFAIMLTLAMAYDTIGITPVMRGALYGLGPVALGAFVVAVCRLGRSTVVTRPEAGVAAGAVLAMIFTPIGVAMILLVAASLGVLLAAGDRRTAAVAGAATAGLVVIAVAWSAMSGSGPAATHLAPRPAGLLDVALYFLKVGAFTVGGGLAMIAFVQDQVVGDFGWLDPQEFIDGLALGQFTPGPILMLAAYVGYKIGGIAGAAVAAVSAFLPSFVLMLGLLPVLDRVRQLAWVRAAIKGMGSAVIGVLAVALLRLVRDGVHDPLASGILIATVIALLVWRVGVMKLLLAGAALGILVGQCAGSRC